MSPRGHDTNSGAGDAAHGPRLARLLENLRAIRDRIAAAAARRSRDAAGVRLVAVTKYVDIGTIRLLLAAGVHDLGENRVQQLIARADALAVERVPAAAPIWHMIGHLQRNKVRSLLTRCTIVHSLDSTRLAEELEHRAAETGATVEAFIEANLGSEQAKTGASRDECRRIAELASGCGRLRIRGLMSMAPLEAVGERSRPTFAALREFAGELRGEGLLPATGVELSMGMSGDFEIAVEEGATIVRVGSALFEGM